MTKAKRKITEYLKENRYSQASFCERWGINKGHMSRILSGKTPAGAMARAFFASETGDHDLTRPDMWGGDGMSDIDHGPAVHDRCRDHKNPEFDYPARFNDRVPKTVKVLTDTTSDVLFGLKPDDVLAVSSGEVYPAWTNRHGAVSAILPSGKRLGLYPREFEVVEWLPLEVTE